MKHLIVVVLHVNLHARIPNLRCVPCNVSVNVFVTEDISDMKMENVWNRINVESNESNQNLMICEKKLMISNKDYI